MRGVQASSARLRGRPSHPQPHGVWEHYEEPEREMECGEGRWSPRYLRMA
jgi:hypothetical protein